MLTEEQRLHGGEADVLVDSNIAGDHRSGRVGEEPAHQVGLGRLGAGTGRRRWQVAIDVEQRGVVVGRVAVDRAVAQPVETLVGAAVDGPGIDVGADRVDLLAGSVVPRAVGDGSTAHRDPAEVVGELLERVGGVERDREVLLAGFAEPDRVIDELAPHEAPVGHVVLGEDVLVGVVEDAVAQVAGVGRGDGLTDTVGVVRSGLAGVDQSRSTERRVVQVVGRSVERRAVLEQLDEFDPGK